MIQLAIIELIESLLKQRAVGIFGAMFMATFKTHWKNGFFAQKGGYEYALLILFVSVFFGLAGPGAYSLDVLLGINLPGALLFTGSAVLTLLVVGTGMLISRRPPASDLQGDD